jgi:hypothetical protein
MPVARTLIDMYPVTGNRADIRRRLVSKFLDENPGHDTKRLASRYRYNVDKLSDGRVIYLDRPARNNCGIDFVIHVSDTRFESTGRRRTQPSYKDIVADLVAKKADNPTGLGRLMALAKRVHECEEISGSDLVGLTFSTGHPPEVVLKVLKWMFIEQDLTYWNYSGRKKLYDWICENTAA